MKKIILQFLLYGIFVNVNAQLSTNEFPVSFNVNMKTRNPISTIIMPELDMKRIEAEDKEDELHEMPPRFGYPHKVNYNLANSGVWMVLPNGDKLWQLNIMCPNALSVNFCYNKFWIPEGGKFFVYSKDRKHSIGAFTSKNNVGDSITVKCFATEPVYGNDMILEYYQPKEVTSDAIISIEYVVHGYKNISHGGRPLGDAGSCMVNINCEEGNNWQNEKKAVARVILQGCRFCTGSLINTTSLSQSPFFLTANHCTSDLGDASANTSLNNFTLFFWNYEAPGCENISTSPNSYYTYGATIIANNPASDFALLRLIEDPMNHQRCTSLYYLGWDNSGLSGEAGVCIHHPKGDVKKISTVYETPDNSFYSPGVNGGSHWRVLWKETTNGYGTEEQGSSGSPLFNSAHKIIGQLHRGTCRGCNNLSGFSRYGKFNVSWTGNNNDSICRRLNCWLDSLDTGIQTMEGLLVILADSIMNMNQQIYGNIRVNNNAQLTIQSEIELMGNSQVIVESGSKLIIDGGTLSNVELVLKAGSSLQITNGGIVDTRNGFVAPVGAIVDITHGQIL